MSEHNELGAKHIFYALVLFTCVGCSSCSMFGGGELSDRQLIEAVADAGCNLKSVKRESGEIRSIDCLETVRVLHER